MAAGKELFKLFGLIGMQGVEDVDRELKKIDKQARRTQKAIDRLGRRVSGVGKVLTKAFTLPILAASVASLRFIDDATELNETVSKTGEIFGESAKDIEAWAATSATSIGQTTAQAMDAASTFAIFGKSAGLAGKDLTKFSTEFVELASDMASFFNTEPSQAITAIGAAFRGETEPIRKYGILLDDATMRQKAFELGLVTTTKKALLPQTKVLAAQALIIEQSKVAQGDFARTSAGLANQKRILRAQLVNISATLGQLFLPAALEAGKLVSRLIGLAERLINAWKALDDATKRTIKGFVLIAAAMGPTVFLMGKLISWSKIFIPLLVALKTGTLSWAGAMAAMQKSMMTMVLLMGTLVTIGWFWFSNWKSISLQFKALWSTLQLSFAEFVNSIVQQVTDKVLALLKIANNAAKILPGLAAKVKEARIGVLKFKAAMLKDLNRERQANNAIKERTGATASLTETIKKAITTGKEALGLKEETAKKTQKEIELEKARQKAIAEGAEKDKQKAAERVILEKDIQQQINELTLSRTALLEIEKQEALLKAEELGADKLEVVKLFALKEQALKDEIRKEEDLKDKRNIKDKLRATSSFGNKINNMLNKFSDNKLKRLDIAEKKEIERIQKSTMSEEEKEAAIQKIQEETEKKRRKIERQRAIREKAAALFNIGINTASAVVEALPNVALSLVVGGLGLAEGLAVATAPLPFFDGGFIAGSDQGVSATVGERGQDELVFPLETGIGLLIDGLMERIGEIELPGFGTPELVGAAGPVGNVHLHIGTFIGDKKGLKELERKLDTIRISENQRKGI